MGRRVLYIHHAGGLGGAPKSLFLLLSKLDYNKYSPKLICIESGPVLSLFKKLPIELELNEKIFPFHGSTVVKKWSFRVFLKNYIGGPISFFNARETIKNSRPEIVHLNSSCLCFTALAVKSVDKNIKVVCHIREPLRRSLSGFVIKYLCYRCVDKFVAIDNFSGNSMKTKSNLQVISNPVDFSIYKPSMKSEKVITELGLENKVIFLFLARVSPGNGVLEMIKVARLVQKKYPSFHFIIAGFDSTARDEYSKRVAIEAKLQSNVSLIGFRNDVTNLIASCDIMIIPFTEPHFARAGIEAAAMGKPCIGANIGGVDESIVHGETGYLYNNIQELYKYCVELGTEPYQREKLGIAAVAFAHKNFDSNISAQKVFQCYESLVYANN